MTQWGLDTLFNPAKRFMDEEKRRLQSTREELGDSSGGKRVDFESGKVTINRKAAEAAEDADGSTAAEDTDRADDADGVRDTDPSTGNGKRPARSGSRSTAKGADAELTPAQLRAAQRRGRLPRRD